jgi:hypothetical protein
MQETEVACRVVSRTPTPPAAGGGVAGSPGIPAGFGRLDGRAGRERLPARQDRDAVVDFRGYGQLDTWLPAS